MKPEARNQKSECGSRVQLVALERRFTTAFIFCALSVLLLNLSGFGQSILTADGLAAFIGTNAPLGGGGGGSGTWTLIAHTNAAAATSGGTATTSAIDTTGATFLIEAIEWAGGGPLVVSDGKGNTWTHSVNYVANNPKVQFYFVTNATGKVGSGHTFSASCPGLKVSFHVYAFSVTGGQPTLDSEASGARTTSWQGTSLVPGSLTPSTANDLFVSAVTWDVNTATIVTNNAHFIYTEPVGFAGNGLMSGYKIHSSDSSAENPSWLESPTANTDADAAHIAFYLK